MATRSRKQAHKEEVSSSERPSSPLRQTLVTRVQEKEELQNLNDRLAHYIEIRRALESENLRLRSQLTNSRETHSKEFVNTKLIFEKEIGDTKALLDDVSRQKVKLEVDLAKAQRENSDLQIKLAKKDKDVAAKVKTIADLERGVEELNSRYNKAVSDQRKAEEAARDMTIERNSLLDQLKVAQQQLESEMMTRVSLENRLTTLNEEMQLKDSIHEQELSQSRSFNEKYNEEIIEEEIREEYEQLRVRELQELREESEAQLKRNREDLEKKFDNQIDDLMKKLENKSNSEVKLRTDLQNLRSKSETLTAKVTELQNSNAFLNSRVKDLENMIEQERNWNESANAEKDAEIQRLLKELQNNGREYQDLLDVKVALDMEINAYRKLLEGEETRLSMSQPNSPAGDVSARYLSPRGIKRKRLNRTEETFFDTQSKSTGDVAIDDFDESGKYIKLFNKGEKDCNVGGWQLTKTVGEESTSFKFHRSVVIKPKSYVTVWSSDSNATHSPPSDIVMKEKRWVVGDEVEAKLLNGNGEEVAQRTAMKRVRNVRSEYYSDENGLENGTEGSNNCCIM